MSIRLLRSGSTPADIAASLCPPPEAFAGQLVTAVVSALHVSGCVADAARRVRAVGLGRTELRGRRRRGLAVGLARRDGTCRPLPRKRLQLHQRLAQLRRELLADWPLDELVGVSPAIQRVRDQVALAARGKTRVLIQGRRGAGASTSRGCSTAEPCRNPGAARAAVVPAAWMPN